MSIFNKVRLSAPKSSNFNLSHERKFTLQMGDLVPILCEDVLPGDKWSVTTQQMLRMMPMISPVMHDIQVYTHFFFVPNRLIWNNWEKFITGGEQGDEEPVFPTFRIKGEIPINSLGDYLGLPTGVQMTKDEFSQLPFRAYQLIFNEYYRDQNLMEAVDIDLGDGSQEIDPLGSKIAQIQRRAWQHDYFTSALPFAQKGAPVQLPIGDLDLQGDITFNPNGKTYGLGADGNPLLVEESWHSNPQGEMYGFDDSQNATDMVVDNSENLEVDLSGSSVNATTIEDLRRAFKLQEWLEKNARAGSRYIESILAHFGVKSSDARLQRPEYLGGGMSPMLISEVLQTSESGTKTPLGEMAGHGLNLNQNHSFSRYFEEHGQIVGIMSIRPKTAYQQGLRRKWTKFDKFDYFWPEFQHIGEQEIKNKEIYYDETDGSNNETFGYIPRYSEYRFIDSSVHGDFRETLEFWHLGRKFNNRPQLNEQFIVSDPSNRIFAVQDEKYANIICQMWHNIKCRRKMSYFGDPSFR